MVPIGTVPGYTPPSDDEPKPAASSTHAGTSHGNSPASPTSSAREPDAPAPAVSAPRDPACTGAELDATDELLRRCETPLPRASEVPSAMRSKVDVRLSSSTPSTSPGGRVDLSLTFRNTTSAALSLYFVGTDGPRFAVEAFDKAGRRVDRPTSKPPAIKKSAQPKRDPKAYRLTLSAGGVARVRLAWDAQKARWAPERLGTWDGRGPYPTAPAGILGTGRYVLRVAIPLLGYATRDADMPKTTIDVSN